MVLDNYSLEAVPKPNKMGGDVPQQTGVTLGNADPDEKSNDQFAEARMNIDVADLAERLSHSSISRESESQALNPKPGSHLDPLSPIFDARSWVKELISLTESDPKSAPSRALGVAFKDLSVFGWGTGAESQKTTGNVLIGIASYLVRLVGGTQNETRVDILRAFEGVIEKGEMLLVLGPPGSGCSTFLKTLSGETANLKVSPDAYINFRGRYTFVRACETDDVF
jgi:ABC-type multidrug transport system fused ATPase/permease subunit